MLILTTFDHDEYVIDALGAGASGFVIKNTDPSQLLHGIRVVAGGEALLSPGLTRRLVARLVNRAANRRVNAGALAQLTEREREVAGLAAYGMSNDEIAVALSISQATAKTPHQPGNDQTRRPRPRTAGRAGIPVPPGRPA